MKAILSNFKYRKNYNVHDRTKNSEMQRKWTTKPHNYGLWYIRDSKNLSGFVGIFFFFIIMVIFYINPNGTYTDPPDPNDTKRFKLFTKNLKTMHCKWNINDTNELIQCNNIRAEDLQMEINNLTKEQNYTNVSVSLCNLDDSSKIRKNWLENVTANITSLTIEKTPLWTINEDSFTGRPFEELKQLTLLSTGNMTLHKTSFAGLQLEVLNIRGPSTYIVQAEKDTLRDLNSTLNILQLEECILDPEVLKNLTGGDDSKWSLSSLATLDISHNILGTLLNRTFTKSPNLASLYGAGCDLEDGLSVGVFENIAPSQVIFTGNGLTTLPQRIFDPFLNKNKNTTVDLHDNHFNCSCNFVWFQIFYNDNRAMFSNNLTCGEKDDLATFPFCGTTEVPYSTTTQPAPTTAASSPDSDSSSTSTIVPESSTTPDTAAPYSSTTSVHSPTTSATESTYTATSFLPSSTTVPESSTESTISTDTGAPYPFTTSTYSPTTSDATTAASTTSATEGTSPYITETSFSPFITTVPGSSTQPTTSSNPTTSSFTTAVSTTSGTKGTTSFSTSSTIDPGPSTTSATSSDTKAPYTSSQLTTDATTIPTIEPDSSTRIIPDSSILTTFPIETTTPFSTSDSTSLTTATPSPRPVCFQANETYIDSRILKIPVFRTLRMGNDTLVYFRKNGDEGSYVVAIDNAPEKALTFTFLNQAGWSLCLTGVEKNFKLDKLDFGETYVVCMLETTDFRISPWDCQSLNVPDEWRHQSWIKNGQKTAVILGIIAGMTASFLISLCGMFAYIKRHPEAVYGKDNVIVIGKKLKDNCKVEDQNYEPQIYPPSRDSWSDGYITPKVYESVEEVQRQYLKEFPKGNVDGPELYNRLRSSLKLPTCPKSPAVYETVNFCSAIYQNSPICNSYNSL